MKKMRLAALGMIMLLALSGCGKKEAPETAAPTTAAVTEAATEAATEAVTEAETETETEAETEAETEVSTEAENEVETEAETEASDKEDNAEKEDTYVDDGKKTGKYDLYAIGENGEYFLAEELMGVGAYIEINEGGKGKICLDESVDEFTWEEKDGKLYLSAEGETIECEIEKGIAFLTFDEGAGMYFVKPGADTSGINIIGFEELFTGMLSEELEGFESELQAGLEEIKNGMGKEN